MYHVPTGGTSLGSVGLVSPSSRSATPSVATHDSNFLNLRSAYRASGGLARGEEIAAWSRGNTFLQLARDIANRRVISFVWRDIIWLPLFQFEPAGHAVRSDIQMLIDELSEALDDWEMAHWFVEPNACLYGELPLTHLATQFPQVHDAARSLRY
jgi:hypothetical protein